MGASGMLVVGLGNPGPDYRGHRHNIGFMAVEEIARTYRFSPWRKRFQGQTADGTVDGVKLLALQPLTYMNLSGQSVGAAAQFFKYKPEQVIVIHDELDLPPGRLRVKKGGGAGGHNGLKSIDAHLGKDYWRVRLGIGHPGDKNMVSNYVLHDFAKADQTWLEPMLRAVADHLPLLLAGKPEDFMNKVTSCVPLPKPVKPAKPAPESGAPG
jgi:peptidyl-tRNA hydrolase, PTH1 family